jgi:hypothetical protein
MGDRFSWDGASRQEWSSGEQPREVAPAIVAASLQRIARSMESIERHLQRLAEESRVPEKWREERHLDRERRRIEQEGKQQRFLEAIDKAHLVIPGRFKGAQLARRRWVKVYRSTGAEVDVLADDAAERLSLQSAPVTLAAFEAWRLEQIEKKGGEG